MLQAVFTPLQRVKSLGRGTSERVRVTGQRSGVNTARLLAEGSRRGAHVPLMMRHRHIQRTDTATPPPPRRRLDASRTEIVSFRPGHPRPHPRPTTTALLVSSHRSIVRRVGCELALAGVACAWHRFMLVRVVSLPEGSRKDVMRQPIRMVARRRKLPGRVVGSGAEKIVGNLYGR
jgi:hypothetical protein